MTKYKKRWMIWTLILAVALLATGCTGSSTGTGESQTTEKVTQEGAGQEETAEKEETEESEEEDAGKAATGSNTVDADAPQIPGLTFESAMEKSYAECFDVYFYNDGYKLFTIDNGGKFLLVPEGKEVPKDLPEDITALQAPISNIYLAATSQMALFSSMDGLDSVRFTSLKKEGWTFDSIKDKMDAGDILFAGKYSEPDYEMLLEEDCGLAIESTMINHTPEIKEMLEDLDIPVMIDRSSYESNPLGRMEWIRFYGQLIGKSDEADAFFEDQKKKVAELDDFENTEKTVAFFYISSDGKAVVRSSDDYVPTMIEMAGARYIFKDLMDETGKSNIPMTIEKFYDVAADADYIVYNASIDGQVQTLDNLKDKDPIMQQFKAVKEGNCWSTGSSMYQRTDIAGDMIMDFHTLFTEDDPAGKLKYLTKLE